MSEKPLPDAVAKLLRKHIHSVLQLEILLLLHQSQPRAWRAVEVGLELRVDEEPVRERLEGLCSGGLVSRIDGPVPSYHCDPASPHDAAVAALAAVYRERRVAVMTYLFSEPREHLRVFADAFRIRKEPKDE